MPTHAGAHGAGHVLWGSGSRCPDELPFLSPALGRVSQSLPSLSPLAGHHDTRCWVLWVATQKPCQRWGIAGQDARAAQDCVLHFYPVFEPQTHAAFAVSAGLASPWGHPGPSSVTSSSSAAELHLAGAAKPHRSPACMDPPCWDRPPACPCPHLPVHWGAACTSTPSASPIPPPKRPSRYLASLPGARCIWQPVIAPAEEASLCLDKVFPGIALEVCCCSCWI